MGFMEAARSFLGMSLIERPDVMLDQNAIEIAVDKVIHAREHPRSGAYYLPTVRQALGVPAIQRAVSLISSTTGMLSMQGYRQGVVMDLPPTIIVRPDPYETPQTFYSTTAAQAAKYGEFVWYIASRDSDDIPAALVNVPLHELRVDKNRDSRQFPKYKWGSIEGTRYSPANKAGKFVHWKNPLTEPYALRGEGPLQLGQIAVSIAVEAETWAANFYGGGGHPSDIIKHSGMLDPTLRDEFGNPDEAGLSEADRLKAQYIARDNATPLVIDQSIEDIKPGKIDEAGAQMLTSRLHQRGDAALLFGIQGRFVEYVQSGTSLTYQNLEMAFTDLVKTCLQPLYLEPIEQAMSDLLPRSTVSRFNVKGFLRADIKTRYDVHAIAIDKGIYDPAYAQKEEGILPGDVEYAPIPFPAPATIPFTVPKAASLVSDWRCTSCNLKLLERAGPGSVAICRRCKVRNEVLQPLELENDQVERRLEIHNHFPADFVRVESPVTVNPSDVKVEPTFHMPQPAPISVTVETPSDKLLALDAKSDALDARMLAMSEEVRGNLAELATAQAQLAEQVSAPRKRKYVPKRGPDGVVESFEEVTAA